MGKWAELSFGPRRQLARERACPALRKKLRPVIAHPISERDTLRFLEEPKVAARCFMGLNT